MLDFKNMPCNITSIGERGQVVIPAEIREKLNLKKGEKLMVFSKGKNFIGMVKAEEMGKYFKEMLSKIEHSDKL